MEYRLTMEKVFDVVPVRKDDADFVVVIDCYDDRFDLHGEKLKMFLELQRPVRFVRVGFAGGVLDLVRGTPEERAFILKQIRISMRAHGTRRVVLKMHRDCRAHGGSEAFHTHTAEGDACRQVLAEGWEIVTSEFPELVEVRCFFVEHKGVYEIKFKSKGVASEMPEAVLSTV